MNNPISQFIKSHQLFFGGIVLALLMMMLDIYSKFFIFSLIDQMQIDGMIILPVVKVSGFFNLVQVWNPGVSFGMFSGFDAKIFITILNLCIVGILLVWLFKVSVRYTALAITFILGGAFGNLLDRVINDAVADFLDFHFFGYHWPAFNLADSFVFIGVLMLLFEGCFIKEDEKE